MPPLNQNVNLIDSSDSSNDEDDLENEAASKMNTENSFDDKNDSMNETSNNKRSHTSSREFFCDAYSVCSNCFCKKLKMYNCTPVPYSADNVYLSDP